MHTCAQAEMCENNSEEHFDLFRHISNCPYVYNPLHQRRHIHSQCPKYSKKQGTCGCNTINSREYQYFLDIFHSNDCNQFFSKKGLRIKA